MSKENLKENIEQSVLKFTKWLEAYGDISYDRMDFWASKTGIFAKKVFYKNKYLGAPFAIWGLALENFIPRIQKWYAKPHREVIGDAHFALAYLNLFENGKDQKHLQRAEEFLQAMKQSATKGYSGYCWGYSFGWETQDGFWEAGVPLITITPYAFWAWKKHFGLTGNEESKEIAISIADFALKDIPEQQMPNGTWCCGYSPDTKDIVINANTYRAACLTDAWQLSGNEEYKKAAERNIEFVLSCQQENGAWYYEAKPPQDNFIDHFHTCFVLRNLYYSYTVLKDEKILNAIKKGYDYYRKHLFKENGRPKHFAVARYAKMRKYEMYDYAESITLGCLLKDHVEGAFELSQKLADDLIQNFQTRKGHFFTRVTSFGTRHKVPYHRWPQAQLFYSLSLLIKKI